MSKISEGETGLTPVIQWNHLWVPVPPYVLLYTLHDVRYTPPPTGPGPLKGPSRAPLWEPSETQCTRPRGWAKSSTRIFFAQLFEKLLGYTLDHTKM
jgi:hypothetical protein